MQRIVQGRSATLTHTFYVDGDPEDPTPDAATVTITRSDNTALYTNENTDDTGAGTVEFTLTPTDTALLDTLTVRWTATFGGQPQTFTDVVEVAGDVFFTLAELRARFQRPDEFTVAQLSDMRVLVETAIEDACGIAFVPRYAIGTADAYGNVTRRGLRRLRGTVTNSGVTAPRVGYEHGLDQPPPRIKQAALMLAKAWLTVGPIDDRTTILSSPEAGITATLAVPGRGGSNFGIPEVDAAVKQYSHRTSIGTIPMTSAPQGTGGW